MKKVLGTLMVVSALMAVGCGKSNNPGTHLSRGGRLPNLPGVTSPQGGIPGGSATGTMPQAPGTGGMTWGQIIPDNDQEVWSFLSTNFSQGEVGTVAGTNCRTGLGYPCRIDFTITQQAQPNSLPIAFQGGNFITAVSSPQGLMPQGGYLTMLIWDSMSGTQDPNNPGQVLTPIPVVIPLQIQNNASYARSGGVVMTFQDSDGVLTFTGQMQGNGWVGVGNGNSLIFQNYVSTSGSGGASGSLGAFGVVACGVFQCQ
jgi:hypothetical protein